MVANSRQHPLLRWDINSGHTTHWDYGQLPGLWSGRSPITHGPYSGQSPYYTPVPLRIGHQAAQPSVLAISSDGKRAAVGMSTGDLQMWDADLGKQLSTWQHHEQCPESELVEIQLLTVRLDKKLDWIWTSLIALPRPTKQYFALDQLLPREAIYFRHSDMYTTGLGWLRTLRTVIWERHGCQLVDGHEEWPTNLPSTASEEIPACSNNDLSAIDRENIAMIWKREKEAGGPTTADAERRYRRQTGYPASAYTVLKHYPKPRRIGY